MDKNEAKKLFEPYIKAIKEPLLREFTEYLWDKLPAYWFVKPASSTGKYHPAFAQDDGGLVRHTLAMTKIWQVLYRGFSKDLGDVLDLGTIACIFHDALKYGERIDADPSTLRYTVKGHETMAANWILNEWGNFIGYYPMTLPEDLFEKIDAEIGMINCAIRYHMGPWSLEGAPKTQFEQLIFIADYMASSKWFEEEIFNVKL